MIDYVMVLDNSLTFIYTIDIFKSIIWTERYSDYGDFELIYPASKENLQKIKRGYFISIEDSDELMIVETIESDTNSEDGDFIKISGRSLSVILTWRIIWYQTQLDGNIQTEVLSLLNRSIIQPSIPERKLENPGLVFRRNEDLQSISISRQFTGDVLYDAIKSICDTYDIGFRIVFDKFGSNSPKNLIFEMYEGKDRSYNQIENPYVVFSPEFGNLLNSNFIESEVSYRNVALVAGEDEGSDRKTTIAGDESVSGWDRRELYVDARDIQSDSGSTKMDMETYKETLRQRGEEKLSEYTLGDAFDGELSALNNYIYGVDYSMGDIVQIENDYGITASARVIEYIRSVDSEKVSEYPTFDILK